MTALLPEYGKRWQLSTVVWISQMDT